MNKSLKAVLVLTVQCCCVGVGVAQPPSHVDRILPQVSVNGRPMELQRVLEKGQLEVVASRWQAEWQRAGLVRREQSGEWVVLSRPSARGFEILQLRQRGDAVEAVSSSLPYLAPKEGDSSQANIQHGSIFFRSLGLMPKGPLIEQIDGNRHAVTGVSQLPGSVALSLEQLLTKASHAGWTKEFSHHDVKRGAVAFLSHASGAKLQLTLHSHQEGTALVISETSEVSKR